MREARSMSPKKPTQLEHIRTTHEVRTAYLRRQDTVATPGGTYTFQRGRQMPAPSQSVFPSSPARAPSRGPASSTPSVHRSSSLPGWPTSEPGWSSSFSDPQEPPTPTKVTKISGARKQWIKWNTDVIPSLLKPYLHLLRVTESLRNLHHDQEVPCTCGRSQRRNLTVTCLYFDGASAAISLCEFNFILLHICSIEGRVYHHMSVLDCTSCPASSWILPMLSRRAKSCSRP